MKTFLINLVKVIFAFIILPVGLGLIFGFLISPPASSDATQYPTDPAVPYEEQIPVPDLAHYLGVEELTFETYPMDAMRAYAKLVEERYGLVNSVEHGEERGIWWFTDPGTEKNAYQVQPIRDRETGLIQISVVVFSEYRMEAAETWDGDISPFLYNPDHWVNCTTCDGTGDCQKCRGRGYDGGVLEDGYTDCKKCDGTGHCPDCYGGKVYQKPWEEMTDQEKREADWKRYAGEMLDG